MILLPKNKEVISEYNMTDKDYNKLYKRFLKRSPKELFDAAKVKLKNKNVLDLCAGTMRASKIAREMGAKVITAVDNSDTVSPKNHNEFVDYFIKTHVEYFVANFSMHIAYDVAICQQAVNYWFNANSIQNLSERVLTKKGILVFNTFNKKPDDIPKLTKTSKTSWEVAYHEGGMVHHLQIAEGVKPHLTSFKWIPKSEFEEVLNRYFKKVTIKTQKSTDIYTCKK